MKILLNVQLQYKGRKASLMNQDAKADQEGGSDSFSRWRDVLYSDLRSLNISHPPEVNIVFVRRSGLARFSWVTDKDGLFHRLLGKQIRDASEPKNESWREEACVKYIKLSESTNTNAPTRRQDGNWDLSCRTTLSRGIHRYSPLGPVANSRLSSASRRSVSKNRSSVVNSHFAQDSNALEAAPFALTLSPCPESAPSSPARTSDHWMSFLSPTPRHVSTPGSIGSAISRSNYSLTKTDADLMKFDLALSGENILERVVERKDVQVEEPQASGYVDTKPCTTALRDQSSNDGATVSTPTPTAVDCMRSLSPQRDPKLENDLNDERQRIQKSFEAYRMDIDAAQTSSEMSTSKTLSTLRDRSVLDMTTDDVALSSTTTTSMLQDSPLIAPASEPTESVNQLTLQLQNIRRQRMTLMVRENSLINSLQALGKNDVIVVSDTQLLTQKIEILQTSLNITQKALRFEQQHSHDVEQKFAHEAQKLQISSERNQALESVLLNCQRELMIEKQQRTILENVIEDLDREMKEPSLALELFEALIKISQVSTMAENPNFESSYLNL